MKEATVVNLRTWLSDSCSKPGFSDMHIDRFDPRWKDRTLWIEGGMKLLQAAAEACASAACSHKLAMVYTLQSDAERSVVALASEEEFRNLLDHSPPSIFIAEPGSEPWVTSRSYESVQTFSLSSDSVKKLFPSFVRCEGLLMKYKQNEFEEISTTVWFVAQQGGRLASDLE